MPRKLNMKEHQVFYAALTRKELKHSEVKNSFIIMWVEVTDSNKFIS